MSRFSINFLLARRILKDKGDRFSRPIVYLSVGGVSLGLVIMMIAIGVTSGYKQEIRNKVIAMGSHIRITHYDQNYSFEQVPINQHSDCILQLKNNPDVVEVQNFATKVGIIKTDDQVEGVVLKGVDKTFSWDFFQKNIIQGEGFSTTDTTASNSIIVSKRMADKLRLKVGDKVHTYFVQDPPRQRSFKISGIYETGLPEYDNMFALVDLRHVRKLNDWNDSLVSGVEVLTRDYDKIDEIGDYIHHHIDYDMKAETIKQIYPEIFEWIALFDMNVAVLLIITTCVCLVTMMSIFFIIVLEQTQTIGILKSLGMKTKQVVGTFILVAGDILLKGMLIGDAIALLLGFLQQKFHFIRLNPDTYYVNYVPIHFDWVQVLLLNAGVFAVCMAVLLIPAWVVSRKITPVNAVQFE
ncbi:MAG: ABC transporter permease [Bacteroidales bacterium]|nr:ABC transporter permease [Bacteroidales bacterium]